MTGAELLALARHSRGSSEGDADTAKHLAVALDMLFRTLPFTERFQVYCVIERMVLQDDEVLHAQRSARANLQSHNA